MPNFGQTSTYTSSSCDKDDLPLYDVCACLHSSEKRLLHCKCFVRYMSHCGTRCMDVNCDVWRTTRSFSFSNNEPAFIIPDGWRCVIFSFWSWHSCFLLSENGTFPLALLVFCWFFLGYMDVSLRVIHFTHHQNITTCHVGRRGINAGAPWWSSTEAAMILTIPLSMPFFHASCKTVMSRSCEIHSTEGALTAESGSRRRRKQSKVWLHCSLFTFWPLTSSLIEMYPSTECHCGQRHHWPKEATAPSPGGVV